MFSKKFELNSAGLDKMRNVNGGIWVDVNEDSFMSYF